MSSYHSLWDGWYTIPGVKKSQPSAAKEPTQDAVTTQAPQEDLEFAQTSGRRNLTSDIFAEVEGPLAALENTKSGASTLTFPNNLGTETNYSGRYAMRIMIYKQKRSPISDLGVVSDTTSPFDRTKKAAQQGRVNYTSFQASSELLNNDATAFAAGALTLKGAANALRVAGKSGVPILSDIASGIEQAAVSAATIGAAYVSTENLTGNPNNLTTDPQAYIHLYMPETLNFVDRHDYDAVSVTDALGVQGLLAQGNTTEFLGRIGERANLFGINLLGQNFTELALFNSGIALNPQLELLYRKTNNREFIFNFRFAPTSAEDAQTIEDIIRTLRYHAAPSFRTLGNQATVNNSRYIIPPSQFEIEFITMDGTGVAYNDRLPRIASCVLSNVDVNYAPSGQFSAFETDHPVETQVQLTFTETVILTKQDVAIGY